MTLLRLPTNHIINLSLREGVFPDRFNQAFVTPHLKNLHLTSTPSKTTTQYPTSTSSPRSLKRQWPLKLENPYPAVWPWQSLPIGIQGLPFQEIALLTVQNEIVLAMENQDYTALTLLYFSLSCIQLHSALFRLRPRISNTAYTQMTHRSITPSTHTVLKNLPKTFKTD